MPQLYDAETGATPEAKPKPTYGGELKPPTYLGPKQIQKASGTGTVTVYAQRAVTEDKVRTAIRWWNAAADAPVFRQTWNRHSADVIVRFKRLIQGDATNMIADTELVGGQFYVNLPYTWTKAQIAATPPTTVPPFEATVMKVQASLLAHELGHTLGLYDMYGQQYNRPGAYGAGATTYQMAQYTQAHPKRYPDYPGAGAHRIMFGGGAPSQIEAQMGLQALGMDPETLGLYRGQDFQDQKKRGFYG